MRSLILYWQPLGSPARSAVKAHLAGLVRAAGARSTAVVNTVGGAHPALARLDVDCVLLHTTFLGQRWLEPFPRWRERSAWIGRLGVPVLAFPQDDYDHSDVLDDWLGELGVSDVFTSLPHGVESLYPTRAGGAAFHVVLTGYLDEPTIARGRAAQPLALRRLDAVYRASDLPYWFGSHGQLKRAVGLAAQGEAHRRGLAADISFASADVIGGDRWLDFLASGRVAPGCESGASAIDRRGELRRAIGEILARRPAATFAEVSAELPPGWDEHEFFAVSPRHLEAAALRTAQVLVEGRYSDVLQPGRHYVPVKRDLSDLGDALALAADPAVIQEMAECAYEEVALSADVSQARFADLVRQTLASRGCDPDSGSDTTASWRALRRVAEVAGALLGWSRPGGLLRRS